MIVYLIQSLLYLYECKHVCCESQEYSLYKNVLNASYLHESGSEKVFKFVLLLAVGPAKPSWSP